MLRDVLARIPGARLAFVGDGPEREALEKHFAGTKTVFTVCTLLWSFRRRCIPKDLLAATQHQMHRNW